MQATLLQWRDGTALSEITPGRVEVVDVVVEVVLLLVVAVGGAGERSGSHC